MQLSVLTPDKQVFEGQIVSVKVPGTLGEFQILKNHAPIVSSLKDGKVTLVTAAGEHKIYDEESGDIKVEDTAGKEIQFDITAGFIEALNNEVSLLVNGVDKIA